jgi:hypothetical protein
MTQLFSVIGIGLTLAIWRLSLAAQSLQSWPAVDTYLKLRSDVRVSFYAALTRENAAASSAEIGPNIDFFLKPLSAMVGLRGSRTVHLT